MQIVLLLLKILALLTMSEQTFDVQAPVDLNCQSTGKQCLTTGTYTECYNILGLTVLLSKPKACNQGYVCKSDSPLPCVTAGSQNPVTDKPATPPSTTTKKTVPRPTGAPNCTGLGLYAAPKCTQYYECVVNNFFFITSYNPVLKSCPNSQYFDATSRKCTAPELSDCV